MDGRRECAVGAWMQPERRPWMAGVEAERSEPTAQAEGSPSGREATRTKRQRFDAECVANAASFNAAERRERCRLRAGDIRSKCRFAEGVNG